MDIIMFKRHTEVGTMDLFFYHCSNCNGFICSSSMTEENCGVCGANISFDEVQNAELQEKYVRELSRLDNPYEKLNDFSIPLREVYKDNPISYPCGIASGCIVDYGDYRILLTVAHAICSKTRLGIELYPDMERGACLFLTEAPYHFALLSKDMKSIKEKIDFLFVPIPRSIYPRICMIDEETKEVKMLGFYRFFETTLDGFPSCREKYALAGNIRFSSEIDDGFRFQILRNERAYYYGLKYTDKIGEFLYEFELPGGFMSNDHFKGCSGGPIVDSAGNLVSLVVSGKKDQTDVIRGVALAKLKPIIDATLKENHQE